eukprot:4425998-Pleurochrysis_carterae.AAC.1
MKGQQTKQHSVRLSTFIPCLPSSMPSRAYTCATSLARPTRWLTRAAVAALVGTSMPFARALAYIPSAS